MKSDGPLGEMSATRRGMESGNVPSVLVFLKLFHVVLLFFLGTTLIIISKGDE